MQIHFDGTFLTVRKESHLQAEYQSSREDFVFENPGVSLPELSKGMTGFVYYSEEKIFKFFDSKQNEFPLPGKTEISHLDSLKEKIPELKKLQVFREAHLEALGIDEVISKVRSQAPKINNTGESANPISSSKVTRL